MTAVTDAQSEPSAEPGELDLPGLPETLDSVDAERQRRRRSLAITFRIFARFGYDEGIAGHATARDPEFPDRFWVNPYALHFSRIKVSDLLLIDENGQVIEGGRRTNKAAFWIHSSIHRARPDVIAVAHAHTIHGRAFGALNKTLDPIVQESCAFYDDHVLFGEYKGLVLERAEGEQIAGLMGGCRAAILRHHGLITVGRSVEEAAWWFITLDRACQMELLARAAGTPRIMSPDEATLAHRQFSNANMARHNFQLLADLVIEQEPDVLD
jgi:ribulose-5-phosphate 4-epimerase/fuculose-1-phosphate aldolase